MANSDMKDMASSDMKDMALQLAWELYSNGEWRRNKCRVANRPRAL
jgi:hypothetical protein